MSNRTTVRHDWTVGYYKQRRLTRSFPTLEAAEKFAKGKQVLDIYRNRGKFTVEWIKTIPMD